MSLTTIRVDVGEDTYAVRSYIPGPAGRGDFIHYPPDVERGLGEVLLEVRRRVFPVGITAEATLETVLDPAYDPGDVSGRERLLEPWGFRRVDLE